MRYIIQVWLPKTMFLILFVALLLSLVLFLRRDKETAPVVSDLSDSLQEVEVTFGLDLDIFSTPAFDPYVDPDNSFGVHAVVLDAENPLFQHEQVSFALDPYFLEDGQIALEVAPIKAPLPIKSSKVQAYSFKITGEDDYKGLFTITIPYDEPADPDSALIGAGYFNPDTLAWQPVLFETDEASRMVIITTDHLSVYGSFLIEGSAARYAHLGSGLFTDSHKYVHMYENVIKGSLNNEMTPAVELGMSVLSDWLDVSGAILTFEGVAYSSDFLGSLSTQLGHFGTMLSMYRIADDYSRANDEHFAWNVYNLVVGQAIGRYGGKAMNIAMIGVTAINYSLDRLQTEAFQMRDDNWRVAYRNFYNEPKYARSNKDWYNLFIRYAKEAGDSRTYNNLIEGELNRYVNLFWQHDVNQWSYFPGIKVFSSYPDENTRRQISGEYKNELLRWKLHSVFDTISRNMSSAHYFEYLDTQYELRQILNRKVAFNVEEIPVDGKYSHADCYFIFDPLQEGVDNRHWMGRLDEKGSMRGGFTVAGHLQAGSPGRIKLYSPDRKFLSEHAFSIIEQDGQLRAKVMLGSFSVSIEGGDVVHELGADERSYVHKFSALGSPPGRYIYRWDLGDGSAVAERQAQIGQPAGGQKTYSPGEYVVKVELLDAATRQLLASDSIKVKVTEVLPDDPLVGLWSIRRFRDEYWFYNWLSPEKFPLAPEVARGGASFRIGKDSSGRYSLVTAERTEGGLRFVSGSVEISLTSYGRPLSDGTVTRTVYNGTYDRQSNIWNGKYRLISSNLSGVGQMSQPRNAPYASEGIFEIGSWKAHKSQRQ